MQHEVFQCLVVGIFVGTGVLYLAMDGNGLLNLRLLLGRNEEHVLVLQGDVGYCAVHDAFKVDGNHFQGAVGFHTVHDGMLGESLLCHTF